MILNFNGFNGVRNSEPKFSCFGSFNWDAWVRSENAWLWWLVLGFGFLVCTRACIQVGLFVFSSLKKKAKIARFIRWNVQCKEARSLEALQ
jgi:hypothetical protein